MTEFPAIAVTAIQAGPARAPTAEPSREDTMLRSAAEKLEAQFLTQMLKATGLGQASESFGGGPGEEQFSSFLVDEYAQAMAAQGGIGLAEMIFHNLKERHDASQS